MAFSAAECPHSGFFAAGWEHPAANFSGQGRPQTAADYGESAAEE